MRILIVYASKTGATEKCAGIIGQKLKETTKTKTSKKG